MRVIEPKSIPLKVTNGRKLPKWPIAALVIAIFMLFMIFKPKQVISPSLNEDINSTEETQPSSEAIDSKFSDTEFRQLYNNLRQPNTTRIENPPSITSSATADAIIVEIAEERGYKLRSEASDGLVSVDGILLQPGAAEGWKTMKNAASNEGVVIQLTSGYRSVSDQLEIFQQRLAELGATTYRIESGSADDDISEVMERAAPPGYSRHHSGYAIDMFCPGTVFEEFAESSCHQWLTGDNYKNARLYGFIPSYPDDTENQGPEPEAWEYIWVGTDITNLEAEE